MTKWTREDFMNRLHEFMHDNPDLSYRECCSILGKRGNENRSKKNVIVKDIVYNKLEDKKINAMSINIFINFDNLDFPKKSKKSKQQTDSVQLTLF